MVGAQQTLTVVLLLIRSSGRYAIALSLRVSNCEIRREDSSYSSCRSGPASQRSYVSTGESGPGLRAPGSQIRDLAHFLEPHHNQRDKKEEEEEEERERAEIRRQQMSKARLASCPLKVLI